MNGSAKVSIIALPSDMPLVDELKREIAALDRDIFLEALNAGRIGTTLNDGLGVLLLTADLLRTFDPAHIRALVASLVKEKRLLIVVSGVPTGYLELEGVESLPLPSPGRSAAGSRSRGLAARLVERARATFRHEPVGLSGVMFEEVATLGLQTRTRTVLLEAGIRSVGDLIVRTEANLLRVPSFGRKSLQDVKSRLAVLGLRLGMDVPDWPPADTEAARISAEVAERISRLQQTRGGARFETRGDRFAMIDEGDADDREVAARPIVRQMQTAVLEKARRFAEASRRLDNQPGWSGIARSATGLVDLAERPSTEMPDVLGRLYATALELGSFVEQDDRLKRGDASYSLPLDPETRRPLEDLVRTLAPWIRAYPSVRQMDDEGARFLLEASRLEPAAAIVRDASDVELLDRVDAAVLQGLREAAARGEFQGTKAGGRVHSSALNLVVIVAMQAAIFMTSAVSSDYATTSPLVHRIGQFLTRAEVDILRLVEGAAPDLRSAIAALLREIGAGPTPLPPSPPQPRQDRRGDGE